MKLRPYLPDDPLPTGALLLEASAGTGKTHTIAELAMRYLTTGHTIDQLLLLTFNNQAAGELRQRLRTHLSAHVETAGQAQRALLQAALDDFDSATVMTIHSFCQQTLRSLGVLGDWDDAETILSQTEALTQQAIEDVFLTWDSRADGTLYYSTAARTGREAVRSALPLSPQSGTPTRFATRVRERFEQIKQRSAALTFDDMITRLWDLLDSPVGPQVIDELRRRHAVVLIDEFQDTDPQQWRIVETAFLTPERPTIMIGDPKQSIYGFRNADLLSYERAAGLAEKRTLTINWRSDQAVVDAVAELFGPVQLGSESTRVTPVKAHHGSRLSVDGAPTAGLWLRHGTSSGTEEATRLIHPDLAGQIHRLLERGRIRRDGEEQAVRHQDIAVLSRTTRGGLETVRYLERHGIPAVWTGSESVLRSEAADDWAAVIEAMATRDRATMILAALTPLLGFTLTEILTPGSAALADASRVIHQATRHLREQDAGLWARYIIQERDRSGRVPPGSSAQRHTMALEQVADLLTGLQIQDPTELREAYAELCAGAGEEATGFRIATELPAVRVMTLHSAKGLQFPIVALPEVSAQQAGARPPFQYVDEHQHRTLFVGSRPGRDSAIARRVAEQAREEELRLLYVGLTRAAHLAIVWHVMHPEAQEGALTALLARDPASDRLQRAYPGVPSLEGRFDPALIDVRPIDGAAPVVAPAVTDPSPRLAPAQFTRTIDTTWRRTSYSGLTAGIYEHVHGLDEVDDAELDPAAAMGEPGAVSPMADLPAGAAFGTAVHEAFEQIDWRASQLGVSAAQLARELAPTMGLDDAQTAAMETALREICLTPLGVLADGASLSEIPLTARLPELDFDLPMGEAGSHATVADLITVLRDHLAFDDPLHDYPEQLAATGIHQESLHGILTGSIDAVLETPGGGFIVVDYKTNRFPVPDGQPLRVGHYHPRAMARAMMQSHYPLQALLYGAALHRYLQWRLPGYDPRRHIAGVGYLFVRGMAGADTPVIDGMPCGVFTWQPTPELFIAASDVLGGRA